jgi:hypothetical protein
MSRAAYFHHTFSRNGEPFEVVLCIEKSDWLSGTPGGEGHKDRAEFSFELFMNRSLTLQKGLQYYARPAGQDGFVRDKDEIAEVFGVLNGVDLIDFCSEGQTRQIGHGANGISVQSVFAE